MTIQEWLDSEIPVGSPNQMAEEELISVKQRLAELVYRNGGRLTVTGWGAMQSGGIYGWQGLDQDDALDLVHLAGIIAGFKLALGAGVEEAVNAALKDEWAKKAAAP